MQNKADGSLLGEHWIVKPVYSWDLQLIQEFITADIADLRSNIHFFTNALVSCGNR
jgi:hypothetical protein